MLLLAACGDDATVARTSPFAVPGRPAAETDGLEAGEDGVSTDGSAPSTDSSSTATSTATSTGTSGPISQNSGSLASAQATAGAGAAAIEGTVVAAGGGEPLAWASVSAGPVETMTDQDGRFTLTTVGAEDPITVTRSGWRTAVVEPGGVDRAGGDPDRMLVVELEPFVVRGLRVSRTVAADRERFENLLALADDSTVNSLIFDTKDETGSVLYATDVALAERVGAIDVAYRPGELLALAREHGLYTITRVVTFEDRIWSGADPEAALAGDWVDPADRRNWQYPIDLAVEACELGFQEIQFDYVRFPAGRTAVAAADRMPGSGEARTEVIAGFLEQAGAELRPRGCEVSAAVFGITMSSPTDEGIGQGLEAVSATVGAISPMLYPSHYSRGWLDFQDPNDHPGPVIADALDRGAPRLTPPAQLRPWLQAFSYNGDQVRAQIEEAEKREAGWLLWNASGNYRRDWLPPS